MDRLNENAKKVLKYQKSRKLRKFLENRSKNRKALGLSNSNSDAIDLVNKIKIKADLLDGEAGVKVESKLKDHENKLLDEIEQSLIRGNLYTAVEQFGFFLHNAYDSTNISEKSPCCTTLWTIRHYVDISNGTVLTRSDKLAQRLLDAIEANFTDGRCDKKRAYSVTKEERDELGFSFSQLQRLNYLFGELQQNTGATMDDFLDSIEGLVDKELTKFSYS